MVFGDPGEPHHRDALGLAVQTEEAITVVLQRDQRIEPADAATLAQVISAILLLSMASPINVTRTVDELLRQVRDQIQVSAALITAASRTQRPQGGATSGRAVSSDRCNT